MKKLILLTVLIYVFGTSCSLLAQGENFKGVYIWDFEKSDGERINLTRNLTDEYEIFLVTERPDFNVLERRKLSSLIGHERSEDSIPNGIKSDILTKGANVVIFGEVGYREFDGKYSLLIKFEELYTRKILFAGKVDIEEDKISDRSHLKKCFTEILPDTDILRVLPSESGGGDLLKADIDAQKWRDTEPVYNEDFRNRTRDGFLQYIWNKKNDDAYDHYVDEEKDCYYYSINKSGFVRHKYINSKNFSYSVNKNPYRVKVYIPLRPSDHVEEEDRLGRGLTVKYNTKKRSCYAFMLNNNGELRFVKIGNIHDPKSVRVLYTEKVTIETDKKYDLSVQVRNNYFYLYFQGKFLTEIYNNDLDGDKFGIVAIGKGKHYLDDVTIFQAVD